MRWLLVPLGAAAWLACSDFAADTRDAGASLDASLDAQVDGGSPACPPAGRILPVEAFAYVPPFDGGTPPQAVACNLQNVLVEDGLFAGLDRRVPGEKLTIGNQPIAGCVGVRFADDVALDSVTVRLSRLADACGASPCVEGDTDAGCSTGRGLQVMMFSGPTVAALAGHALIRFNEQPANYVYQVVPGAHVVVACRGGEVAVTRDDVGVDAIFARCSR